MERGPDPRHRRVILRIGWTEMSQCGSPSPKKSGGRGRNRPGRHRQGALDAARKDARGTESPAIGPSSRTLISRRRITGEPRGSCILLLLLSFESKCHESRAAIVCAYVAHLAHVALNIRSYNQGPPYVELSVINTRRKAPTRIGCIRCPRECLDTLSLR